MQALLHLRALQSVGCNQGAATVAVELAQVLVADFRDALQKSMTDTMLGKEPTNEDVDAMAAFVETLTLPPNPHRESGRLSAPAARGEAVFQSDKAGCAQCHPAPAFTDGLTHDVGLGAPTDVYGEYNTPSLRGVYDRVRLLHDGSAKSLEDLLSGPHNPSRVTGMGQLSADDLRDLIAYLESL